MDQQTCLGLPSHATYLGVCYPGDNFTMTISNPQDPSPVVFYASETQTPVNNSPVAVPEPGMFGCIVLAVTLFVAVWTAGPYDHNS